MDLLEIDGSEGEGGGQVLRTSLSLSMVTGQPFRLVRARAGRKKPGLMRQHLTAVNAAVRLCGGQVEGAQLGSQVITFRPGRVQPGGYHFSIGTAGSTTLVCQTVLPPLLCAHGSSKLSFEGGTHNPMCPPYPFLARAFLPLVARMGVGLTSTLVRPGYYPAGGGQFALSVAPAHVLAPLTLHAPGALRTLRAVAERSRLPAHVGARELGEIRARLGMSEADCEDRETESVGPGNVVWIEAAFEHVTEIATGFGERGVPAERVGAGAADEMARYLAARVPVGEHLADQLLVPLALAGGGSFDTLAPSLHTRTNAALIERFLPVRFALTQLDASRWRIEVARREA